MKRIFLVAAGIGIAIALTGCQSGKTSSTTDDANSAPMVEQSAAVVNAPPVPPIPSRTAQ